jgi:hypothetical protein
LYSQGTFQLILDGIEDKFLSELSMRVVSEVEFLLMTKSSSGGMVYGEGPEGELWGMVIDVD